MLVKVSTRYVLRRHAHIIPVCQTVHKPLFATVLFKELGPSKGHSVTQLLEGKCFLASGITLFLASSYYVLGASVSLIPGPVEAQRWTLI